MTSAGRRISRLTDCIASARPGAGRRLGIGVVRTVRPAEPVDVYDLTIEGQHEFFASGVLVHNCLAGEVGLWQKWKAAWDESIRYAVRIAPARIIAEGTPKATMPARELVKRLIDDPAVPVRRLRMIDNAANLDDETVRELLASRGTSLERQELTGDLIENVTGALWTTDVIDSHRVAMPPLTPKDPYGVRRLFEEIQPVRVCIGVDPAVTYSDDSDEHGIVVVAKGHNGHIYVLEDLSKRAPVTQWPHLVMDSSDRWQVDRVIGEVNNGGDYIEATMRAEGFSGGYETVRATRGKQLRAEPLAQFYKKGFVHHVGTLPELEVQMTSWVPGETDKSPDRLDALVWGCAWLEPRLSANWEQLYLPREPAAEDEEDEEPVRRTSWADVYAPRTNQPGRGGQQPVPIGPGVPPGPQAQPVQPPPRRGGWFS